MTTTTESGESILELIFAYIENYRTFHNQSVSFSDKFSISYDNIDNNLKIIENDRYINIFPKHINNISCLVGKNATGKSSLISLLAKKLDTRRIDHEIMSAYPQKASKNSSSRPRLSRISDYFFIYYLGKSSTDENLFIFESCNPLKYRNLFNQESSTYIPHGHDWDAWLFKTTPINNTIIKQFSDYKITDLDCDLTDLISIISFDTLEITSSWKYEIKEDPSVPEIGRRSTSIEALYFYKQLEFLVNQLKRHSSTQNCQSSSFDMYQNSSYTFTFELEHRYPFSSNADEFLIPVNIVYKNALPLKKKLSRLETLQISFLEDYFWHYLTINTYASYEVPDYTKELVKKLTSVQMDTTLKQPFKRLEKYYYNLIKILFRTFSATGRTLTNLKPLVKSFYKFLKISEKCNIPYSYDTHNHTYTLTITKESNIQDLHNFFYDVLDEAMIKTYHPKSNFFGDFINCEIHNLSAGEEELLSLFTTLNEQISICYPEKKQYILLLDETARSLHPERCRNFIFDLIDYLSTFSGKQFQLILTSHSPFIVSDLPKNNVILLNKGNENSYVKKPSDNSFGQNIHTILKHSFFLDTTFGNYSKEIIMLVNECLEHFDKKVKIINKFFSKFNIEADHSNQPQDKVSTEKEAITFLKYVIEELGEPILKQLFSTKFDSLLTDQQNQEKQIFENLSKAEKRAYLEAQLKQLDEE